MNSGGKMKIVRKAKTFDLSMIQMEFFGSSGEEKEWHVAIFGKDPGSYEYATASNQHIVSIKGKTLEEALDNLVDKLADLEEEE